MQLFNLLKIIIVIYSILAPSILSSQPIAIKLNAEDRKDILRIETYLNEIKSLRADFLQVSSSGDVATGKILMLRPGRIRFEYDPPSPILLVADGAYLRYIDKELEQVTHLWLENTPVWFLVKEDIKLAGDIALTKLSRSSNVLAMTLTKSKEPEKGVITLIFSDKPLLLKKWIITDAQGIKTTITLNNSERAIEIDPLLFEFNGLTKIK